MGILLSTTHVFADFFISYNSVLIPISHPLSFFLVLLSLTGREKKKPQVQQLSESFGLYAIFVTLGLADGGRSAVGAGGLRQSAVTIR